MRRSRAITMFFSILLYHVVLLIITTTSSTTVTNLLSQPIYNLQQTSQPPQWYCNSLRHPDLLSPDNCNLIPSCSLRSVQCMIFNSTTKTLQQTPDESPCVSPKPVLISADCQEVIACASLHCAEGRGQCTFEATQVNQPFFCKCLNGWMGPQCNTCLGTKSTSSTSQMSFVQQDITITPPFETECSNQGFLNSTSAQVYDSSTSQITTSPFPHCLCQCSTYRAGTFHSVPQYLGKHCSCSTLFIGLLFPNTTYSSAFPTTTPSVLTNISTLTEAEKSHQYQLQLLINDIGFPIDNINIIPSPQPNAHYITPYISTTNLVNPSSPLQYFFSMKFCPSSPSPFTSQQQLLDISQAKSKFEQYLTNPNAIIYLKEIFPDTPTLTLFDPTDSSFSSFPFTDVPASLPLASDQRPITWRYNTGVLTTSIIIMVVFVVGYALTHNHLVSWYNDVYHPRSKAFRLRVAGETYNNLLSLYYQEYLQEHQLGHHNGSHNLVLPSQHNKADLHNRTPSYFDQLPASQSPKDPSQEDPENDSILSLRSLNKAPSTSHLLDDSSLLHNADFTGQSNPFFPQHEVTHTFHTNTNTSTIPNTTTNLNHFIFTDTPSPTAATSATHTTSPPNLSSVRNLAQCFESKIALDSSSKIIPNNNINDIPFCNQLSLQVDHNDDHFFKAIDNQTSPTNPTNQQNQTLFTLLPTQTDFSQPQIRRKTSQQDFYSQSHSPKHAHSPPF